MRPTRRAVMAGAAAFGLARPAFAQSSGPWAGVEERAASFDQIRAMIVSVDGERQVARVFAGPALSTPVNVKSVSKTIVSALTGCAIDRGEIPGIDATIGELAPGLIPSDADPRARELTIENLLSMQAGLERTSGGNYGAWISSGNWVADALARDFVEEPGQGMLYSTGSTHILGAVLSEATGLSLLDQARQRLGGPLGIEIPPWTRDPQGRYMGGNQMALSPEGLLRFGEMYRMDGTWNGARVLGAGYVEDSWRGRTRSRWSGLGYGLGWFLGSHAGADYALARGYGGQVICVAPDLALTMVITSDPDRPARSQGYFGDLMGLMERSMEIVAQG
ncbi:serine hydrolase [Palleronia sp. LCG004]|uniref:serine hydrolase domain-containing protein n=1 Tax=Palleronia sp. LCG004 TaxID=3079304 RepID=UPI002943E5FC|nr:serine hydrolase [Palleronia sp. LCG004]WOI56384.1 serine hydrolase [Palleronia sp. LCG004]